MEFSKRIEQIEVIIRTEKKISRAKLAETMNISPSNLNRDIDKLVKFEKIRKDKDGRDVYYYINEIKEEIPEKPIDSIMDNQPIKILTTGAKYKRDIIYELLKKEKREIQRLEIAKLTGIDVRNIDRSFKHLLKTKRIVKRIQGKFVFYRLPDIPFTPKKLNFITNSEVYINRIPALKEFLKLHKYTEQHSERTIESYAREIIYFFRFLSKSLEDEKRFYVYPIEQITLQHYTDYMRFLTEVKHYADNSLKSVQTALKSFFRDCYKKLKLIPENILDGITSIRVESKKGIDINQLEFQKMIAAAKEFVEKTLLIFLLDTGARVSEIARASLIDIDYEGMKITIHESKKRIKDKIRVIDVSQKTLDTLKEYIEKYRPKPLDHEELAIFISEKGRRRMRKRAISDIIRKIRILAGIKKEVTAHSLRRACARMLWERGVLLEVIMKRLGHNNSATTWGYIHETPAFLESQYRIAQKIQNETSELMQKILEVEKQ